MLLNDRLPSNQSLLVFESAARLLNFTAAAKELGSTQSAVSQLMRSLEHNLALNLFNRVYRGIELTDSGEKLLKVVQLNLNNIANCIEKLQQDQNKPVLNVAMDYAFAAYWLLPRLAEYRESYPDVDVRVISSQNVNESFSPDIDIAIFFASRPLKNAMLLFNEQVFPICSPSLLEKIGNISSHKTLANLPLLKLTDDNRKNWLDWPRFFEGRRSQIQPLDPVLTFNNYTLLVQAAIAGQGVGLGWHALVDDIIDRGMLVAMDDFKLSSNGGYYASQSAYKTSHASEQFMKWLQTQVSVLEK